MDKEQVLLAFHAFVQGLDENDEDMLQQTQDMYSKSAHILMQNIVFTHVMCGVPSDKALQTNLMTAILFGRYLERLEQEKAQLEGLTHDNRPQS